MSKILANYHPVGHRMNLQDLVLPDANLSHSASATARSSTGGHADCKICLERLLTSSRSPDATRPWTSASRTTFSRAKLREREQSRRMKICDFETSVCLPYYQSESADLLVLTTNTRYVKYRM